MTLLSNLFTLPCFDKAGVFDLILTILQKLFSGAKLRLKSNKTEHMFVSRKKVKIEILNFQRMQIFLQCYFIGLQLRFQTLICETS